MKNYDVAEKLLDASLEIRGATSGQQSKEYAAGLVKLGDLEASRGKPDQAMQFYKRAVALGDSPEVASALIYLGIHTNTKLDLPVAIDYFQRAIAVAPGPKELGRAMTWLALAESRDPAMAAQAESHFRTAIAQQDPNSSGESTTLDLFARFLEQHDRGDEARELRARSSEIVKSLIREASVSTRAAYPEVYSASVSQGIAPPKLVQKVEPEYSEDARAAKYEGTVALSVVVGTDGLAHNAQVVKSLGSAWIKRQ